MATQVMNMNNPIKPHKPFVVRFNFSKHNTVAASRINERYDHDHADDADDRSLVIETCKQRKISDVVSENSLAVSGINDRCDRKNDDEDRERVKRRKTDVYLQEEEEKDEKEEEEIGINPSYVFLPAEKKMTRAESITKGSAFGDPRDVLNTVCKINPPKLEDRPKTSDEATRQRQERKEREHEIEDQRYEIDMWMHRLISTAETVKKQIELLSQIKDGSSEEVVIDIERCFDSRQLRCIEQLYGGYGEDVVERLRSRPHVVLPVLLNSLIAKQKELKNFKRALFKTDYHDGAVGR